MPHADKIIIANCGGFWGDDPGAALRQVQGGSIDYLVMDYLAEVTMAILQKQRQRKPTAGYATDFLAQLRDVLPGCVEKGVRIISNAGGINPLACRDAVVALAKELGLSDHVRVGVVLGDDIYPGLDDLIGGGEQLLHLSTERPLKEIRDRVLSANVYIGAAPLVRALEMGANIVIAGRVTDTAVTLAPMIFEFGWAADDWDRIAAGVVAGHIVECGPQCTGGNFTDWQLVPSYDKMGYPLVEASPDGSFVITKHDNTGGLVTVHTVTEQLLYELGPPLYLSPDCTARFDTIQLSQEGPDRVRVSGVQGLPAPERLKVSISFHQGYRAFGRLIVTGHDAMDKAHRLSDAFWTSAGGHDHYESSITQYVGWNACHPSVVATKPGEVMVQLGVRDSDRNKIDQHFSTQVVPRVLGTIPGITYLADQGRPRASEVLGYWPALISRNRVPLKVRLGEKESAIPLAEIPSGPEPVPEIESAPQPRQSEGTQVRVPLYRLCLARSGDKGDTCNVGLIARSPEIYHWMIANLTSKFVKDHFEGICEGQVDRHCLSNLLAVNFLLHDSLGGGGTLSLLLDAQGKTYAQYLLAAEVSVDPSLLEAIA